MQELWDHMRQFGMPTIEMNRVYQDYPGLWPLIKEGADHKIPHMPVPVTRESPRKNRARMVDFAMGSLNKQIEITQRKSTEMAPHVPLDGVAPVLFHPNALDRQGVFFNPTPYTENFYVPIPPGRRLGQSESIIKAQKQFRLYEKS